MDVINRGAASINEGIAYLRSNAWPIVFCLALWFLVRPQVMAYLEETKNQRTPQQVQDHDRELRRVRQMQQLQAEQNAKINAQRLAEEKAARLAQSKKEAKKKQAVENKTKSGTSSLSMNGFSTQPSYRPTKRTVRRG